MNWMLPKARRRACNANSALVDDHINTSMDDAQLPCLNAGASASS